LVVQWSIMFIKLVAIIKLINPMFETVHELVRGVFSFFTQTTEEESIFDLLCLQLLSKHNLILDLQLTCVKYIAECFWMQQTWVLVSLRLCNLMCGPVSCIESDSQGTRFWVCFPLSMLLMLVSMSQVFGERWEKKRI